MRQFLAGIDARLLAASQAFYDYLWDRWGLHVGAYRLTTITLAISGATLARSIVLLWLGHRGEGLGALFAAITLLLAGFLIFGLRFHFREIREQAAGRFKAINEKARRDRTSRGRFIAVSVFVLWFLAPAVQHDSLGLVIDRYIQGALFIAYSYTCCVLVRPRNETRFARAERGLAFSGA